jgi:hypothetical protein
MTAEQVTNNDECEAIEELTDRRRECHPHIPPTLLRQQTIGVVEGRSFDREKAGPPEVRHGGA